MHVTSPTGREPDSGLDFECALRFDLARLSRLIDALLATARRTVGDAAVLDRLEVVGLHVADLRDLLRERAA
jgi:hypothetical protein